MARTPEETARRRDAKRTAAAKRQMDAFRTTLPCAFHRTARKRLFQ